MASDRTDVRCWRVVAVSRQAGFFTPALTGLDAPTAEVVVLSSAPRAAAELVTGPVDALLVDLRLMGLRNLPLLEVARRERIAVLGAGTIPLGVPPAKFSGLRVVDLHDLAACLAQVLAVPLAPPAPRAGKEAQPFAAEDEPSPAPPPVPPEPVIQRAAPTAARADRPEASLTDTDFPDGVEQQFGTREELTPGCLDSLLSPEELSALLENDP